MAHYEHEMEKDGFTVRLELLPEFEGPDWDFESEEERADLIRKIEQGALLWFCARVSAWKAGVELGVDYLGGCCYDSVSDFVGGEYFADMVDSAVAEARTKITALCSMED